LAVVAATRLRDVGSLAAMMVMVTRLAGDEEAMTTAARAMVTATMVAGERWRWGRATNLPPTLFQECSSIKTQQPDSAMR
jgi:hypothetical protein